MANEEEEEEETILERLTQCAFSHGNELGAESEIADLSVFFNAAFLLLTAEQRQAFWNDDDVREIVTTIDEYGELAAELYPE
jgi:hypothetical protein